MNPALVHCPEFPRDSTWINTRRPLSVAGDLRGRVTVLDFWAYCCINCMHVLPVLRRIEDRFAKEPVTVIGVHSAKFISEKDPENIRRAVQRYGVVHPVVVDSEHDIWERFGVRAWPTLVLADAAGYVRETISGEIDETTLAAKIDTLLDEGRRKGILAAGRLDVTPEPDTDGTFLRFPGKGSCSSPTAATTGSSSPSSTAGCRGSSARAAPGATTARGRRLRFTRRRG